MPNCLLLLHDANDDVLHNDLLEIKFDRWFAWFIVNFMVMLIMNAKYVLALNRMQLGIILTCLICYDLVL